MSSTVKGMYPGGGWGRGGQCESEKCKEERKWTKRGDYKWQGMMFEGWVSQGKYRREDNRRRQQLKARKSDKNASTKEAVGGY
jgi:hypothetical protein